LNNTSYNSNLLDSILRDGDKLYQFLKSLPRANKDDLYLEFGELPEQIGLKEMSYSVALMDRYYSRYDEDENKTSSAIYIPLQEALHKALNKSNKILAMIGEFAISLYFTGGFYYVFDPHSRDSRGQIKPINGKAVLMQFSDFNNTMNYIKYLRDQCANSSHPTIQLRPVLITINSTHPIPSPSNENNFLEVYLKDQEEKKTQQISE